LEPTSPPLEILAADLSVTAVVAEVPPRVPSTLSVTSEGGIWASLGDLDVAGAVDLHVRQLEAQASEVEEAVGGIFRLGIPVTDRDTLRTDDGEYDAERDLRYLQISHQSRKRFQEYAKSLKEQLSVECADCNPYVQALAAHRQELADQVVRLDEEVVDSLAARLATQRSGALASLHSSSVAGGGRAFGDPVGDGVDSYGDREDFAALQGFFCGGAGGCFPELQGKRRRSHRFVHEEFAARDASEDHSSTCTSTTEPNSALSSEPEVPAPAAPIGHPAPVPAPPVRAPPWVLPMRLGNCRLQLEEVDREGFLQALGLVDDVAGGPLRSL